ncbi:MAG TPA: MotA/TolQ/ExbB proton channel family protein [Elusimicrobia bacterium]|nr:MotA/TolQ/ExbB proton channel family protein [Elusimicrobiota bacterium]HBT61553.1 MotA/TolQ/ExbB proton channel family protein [Elusimicrobiota bacterium]
MDLKILTTLALTGGDWVIYILLLCSVLAAAVIVERAILLRREERELDALDAFLLRGVGAKELSELEKTVRRHPGASARILQAGLAQAQHGPAGVEDHLVAATLVEKRGLEKRLLILGTLGNNAPFVGLFGTVLGVIKAFHDLSQSGSGPEVVMQGLSEALVATAVGLFVAIPCVVSFNYLSGKAKDLMSQTEALGRILLAQVRAQHAGRG